MKPAIDVDALPDETLPRFRILAEHSRPNPNRPRLAEEWERMWAPTDEKCREAYLEMEERSFRIRRLIKRLGQRLVGQKYGR